MKAVERTRANRKTGGGLTVGILANEFFDPTYGGIGGFGWAAKEAEKAARVPLNKHADEALRRLRRWSSRDVVFDMGANTCYRVLLLGLRSRYGRLEVGSS